MNSCSRSISTILATIAVASALPAQSGELLARSVLPADTFVPGPTSGQAISGPIVNGAPVPFRNKQPVQGFSAVLPLWDGLFIAMSDNGFGSIENSADYLLAVYVVRPDFRTVFGGTGGMDVLGVLKFSDPHDHIPFAIVNELDPARPLTGADFDIESIRLASDFTFWVGDEFGPYLLHFDLQGELMEPPIPLPDQQGGEIRAPQNGGNEEASALRIMNAINAHAQFYGSPRPVFSPWEAMIDDGNPATVVGSRANPPAGLDPASSEIFSVRSLQRAGYDFVCWTVNDGARMTELMTLGVNGIISDDPALLYQQVAAFDANGDGQPGDYLDANGLIDTTKFDAQGHRGARNLRPENTLPSMEIALDSLMTTLELDCGVSADGVAMLGHDPYISASKARLANGQAYTSASEVLLKDLTAAQIQQLFIADQLLNGRPLQTNDRSLSPVSQFFTLITNLPDAYAIPTLDQVFAFVSFYESYYRTGIGASHPMAFQRAENARKVRFNIETKLNPRIDRDSKGNVFADRTVEPAAFASAVTGSILTAGLASRADVQSFDFRSLLWVQQNTPSIRTVCLFGDFPKLGALGDGTNLQADASGNTRWLAGLEWPYRSTTQQHPFNAPGSGGYEGMALSIDGTKLYPLLEKPLVGGNPGELLIPEFDLATEQYTGVVHTYQLDARGTAIGDFLMFSATNGIVIERDGSQGSLTGHKKVYEIRLNRAGGPVAKREAIDLLNIRDPYRIATGQPGDVGIGPVFAMPFVTIEGVLYFSPRHIGILNDNNYPFSVGRHVGSGAPDDNEFVVITLDQPLGQF